MWVIRCVHSLRILHSQLYLEKLFEKFPESWGSNRGPLFCYHLCHDLTYFFDFLFPAETNSDLGLVASSSKAAIEAIEAKEKIAFKKIDILAQPVSQKIQDVKVKDTKLIDWDFFKSSMISQWDSNSNTNLSSVLPFHVLLGLRGLHSSSANFSLYFSVCERY